MTKNCLHCGIPLETEDEINDRICKSCATALTCSEADYSVN